MLRRSFLKTLTGFVVGVTTVPKAKPVIRPWQNAKAAVDEKGIASIFNDPNLAKSKTLLIPIDQLRTSTPCRVPDGHEIKMLRFSIAYGGLKHPIVVTYKDGYYYIIDGVHRWLACKQLGHKIIIASVI